MVSLIFLGLLFHTENGISSVRIDLVLAILTSSYSLVVSNVAVIALLDVLSSNADHCSSVLLQTLFKTAL